MKAEIFKNYFQKDITNENWKKLGGNLNYKHELFNKVLEAL